MRDSSGCIMRPTVLVMCTAGMVLALLSAPAAAGRSRARNREAIAVTCTELGDAIIEVVNRGRRGTGKVQGTYGWRCIGLICGLAGETSPSARGSDHRDAKSSPKVAHHGLE
jgi:hypothetical protein